MKVGDTYMYLPEEVILRVNKIEGDTVLNRPCRKRTRTI